MKRLKTIFLDMDPNTSTYSGIYNGAMLIHDPQSPNVIPWEENEAIYYADDIGYEITTTHKLAQSKPTVTIRIPVTRLQIPAYTPTIADFCLREMAPYIDDLNADLYNRSRPDEENGKYYLCRTGGEVLVRNTAYFAVCSQKNYISGNGISVYLLPEGQNPPPTQCLCIRIQVQLPKKRLKKSMQMLCRDLPSAVEQFIVRFDTLKLAEALALSEKQTAIRAYLKDSPYCAFIANSSILPRLKNTDLPMTNAVPFRSAPADEIEISGVRGMAIKRGVTVITGGGYSGKSTLLDAISAGIYDHCLGDGRELCITDSTAMTVSAEDGRSIKSVNISPFIKWLPGGDTSDFSTDHASGSTSQAANIMEAVDYGAKLLLIDEDRSATNFMIRDRMMKALIEKEPITPFTDRVNELYESCGVSTILVIGGSGEYLAVADKIYMMDDFLIHDVTDRSKAVCRENSVMADLPPNTAWTQNRTLYAAGFTSYPEGMRTERLEVSDMGFILFGDEAVDIRGLHDIISPRQLDAIGYMLRLLAIRNADQRLDLRARIDELYSEIEEKGLDLIYSTFFTTTKRFLDLPRKCELKAVINRMRRITYKAGDCYERNR